MCRRESERCESAKVVIKVCIDREESCEGDEKDDRMLYEVCEGDDKDDRAISMRSLQGAKMMTRMIGLPATRTSQSGG